MSVAGPIIQGLWIGDRLSAMERCSVASFLAHGHRYHLYTYGPVAGVPVGAELRDANEILSRDRIFKYKEHDSYAGFANLFRYKLLHDRGGWWVDTDVICLRPFDFARGHVFAAERRWRSVWPRWQVNNCIIKAPAGSAIMRAAFDEANTRDPVTLRWGDTGPRLLDRLVARLGHRADVAPPRTFCPIDHWRWRDALRSGPIGRARAALATVRGPHAIHLWNEWWRRNRVDKDARHDPRCLYERLRARYEPPMKLS
jgi:hypothetical protein